MSETDLTSDDDLPPPVGPVSAWFEANCPNVYRLVHTHPDHELRGRASFELGGLVGMHREDYPRPEPKES